MPVIIQLEMEIRVNSVNCVHSRKVIIKIIKVFRSIEGIESFEVLIWGVRGRVQGQEAQFRHCHGLRVDAVQGS